MRTYLILKEKAERFNQDREIQSLLKAYKVKDKPLEKHMAAYNQDNLKALQAHPFDLETLRSRGPGLERLDQLTLEIIMGVR
jgi:xylose isomerase